MKLDRAGIFKAKPIKWTLFKSDSGAVAINIEFKVTAQLVNHEWESWAEYDATVWGAYWVVKKDQTINTQTVEQLARSIGWNGDLRALSTPVRSDIEVQITVKEDEYDGKTQYKAGWLNPGNYEPIDKPDEGDLDDLHGRFGSLLKAAAAAVRDKEELPF